MNNKLKKLISHLKENHLTIAVAESLTGGRISSQLTKVSGASNYFLGGVVAYSNFAKSNVLKVSEETLEKFFPVSSETCSEMAENVRKLFGADIGVSTTGLAGPDTDESEKEVGLVFVSVSTKFKTEVFSFHFKAAREENILKTVEMAGEKALEHLKKGKK